MPPEIATSEKAWCGWVKPAGGSWSKVCESDTHDGVWAALLSHVTSASHVERLILKAGETPHARRPRR